MTYREAYETWLKEFADDPCVGCVVKLLKKISEKKRKSEKDDLLPYRPLCHQIFIL